MNNEGNILPEGRLEILEAQIEQYLADSPDKIFSEYLLQLKERIRNQKFQVELMQEELDKAHRMQQWRREQECNVVQKPEVIMPEAKHPDTATNESMSEENPQYIEFRDVQPVQPPLKKKSGSTEFMIGTAILSVVGGAFILTALVMLGMYFMNGFVKGMCIYAAALLLLGVSELVIHRKWHKLATVFSAIAIGGLYLSTVLNYLSLHNFGMLAALIITMLITLFVILLSRKRDSLVYRILGLIAGYLCLLTVGEDITNVETWVLTGIILIINFVYIVVPMRKYKSVFHVTHMCWNVVFAYLMDWRLGEINAPLEFRMILLVGLILIMQLLLIVQMRYERKAVALGNNEVNSDPLKVAYWVCTACFGSIFTEFVWNYDTTMLIRYGSIAAICVICISTMLVLRRESVKWYPYYLMNLLCLTITWNADLEMELIVCVIALLAVAKLLSLWRIPQLRFSDAYLTALTCFLLLGHIEESGLAVYLLLASVIISVFFISQWQTYFEIILVYTLGIFAVANLNTMLQLPAMVGLLFVGILLFNNVRRFVGEYIIIFNGAAVAGEIVCFLLLINPTYQNAYFTYLCMLVFGLATIVLTFQEKYHMDFKHKNLIMAGFLTYMALVMQTTLPIINSILLMVIALVCVGTGFVTKDKVVRIYGLVLSLLVCGKIVLYDYVGVSMLQKTVLFFTVGVIALIIAGIYIILEKRNVKEEA